MASEQENQPDQVQPQASSAGEAAADIESHEQDQALPGDAASEPVNDAGAEAAETAEAPAPAAVVDAQSEQPDGAVEAESDAPLTTPGGEGVDAPGEVAVETEAEVEVDAATLEAMLFSTHHPLTGGRLAELLDVPSTKPIRKAIRQLNESYQQSGRCFRIEQVAGGFQMLTLAEYGPALQVLHQREADSRLTKAALETLAIIAYKQPILRADVEAIRGVASGETIRSLMEKHLVKIAGRAEIPGRPILYGTTKRFLEVFGLNSLRDLPQAENLPRPAARQATAPAGEPIPAAQQDVAGSSASEVPAPAPAPAQGEPMDADDQAATETVQLTHQAAEAEAVAAHSIAEDAAESAAPAGAEPTPQQAPTEDKTSNPSNPSAE